MAGRTANVGALIALLTLAFAPNLSHLSQNMTHDLDQSQSPCSISLDSPKPSLESTALSLEPTLGSAMAGSRGNAIWSSFGTDGLWCRLSSSKEMPGCLAGEVVGLGGGGSNSSKRRSRRRSESRSSHRRRRRNLSRTRGHRKRDRMDHSRQRHRSRRDSPKPSDRADKTTAMGGLDKRYEPYKKLAKKLDAEKNELDLKVAKYEQKIQAHQDSERYEIYQLHESREEWTDKLTEASNRIEKAQLRLRRCRGLDIDQMQSPEEVDYLFDRIYTARQIVFNKLMNWVDNATGSRSGKTTDVLDANEERAYWPLPPPPELRKEKDAELSERGEDVCKEESPPPPPPPPLMPINYESDEDNAGSFK